VHCPDPQLAIDWGITNPVVSAKDRRYPRLPDWRDQLRWAIENFDCADKMSSHSPA
jgi:hypothetical protein